MRACLKTRAQALELCHRQGITVAAVILGASGLRWAGSQPLRCTCDCHNLHDVSRSGTYHAAAGVALLACAGLTSTSRAPACLGAGSEHDRADAGVDASRTGLVPSWASRMMATTSSSSTTLIKENSGGPTFACKHGFLHARTGRPAHYSGRPRRSDWGSAVGDQCQRLRTAVHGCRTLRASHHDAWRVLDEASWRTKN